MAGWSVSELARRLDVPVPTVSSWVRMGLVTPEQVGRGRAGHVLGLTGLLELLAVLELGRAGFNTRQIRRAVENLRTLSGYDRPLSRLTLVVSGQDIAWKDADEVGERQISALRQPGQALLIFPVGELHADLLREAAGDREEVLV